MAGDGIGEVGRGQVTQIGRIQRTKEASAHRVDAQLTTRVVEVLDVARHLAHGGGVQRLHTPLRTARHALAPGVRIQDGHERVQHIVDVDQVHRRSWIMDGDGQAAGDVVAERRHRGVVVGATPLAEHVRQSEDMQARLRIRQRLQQRLLSGQLARAIRIVALGLGGGSQHHGHGTAAQRDQRSDSRRQIAVAHHELGRVLGAIHPGEVEHDVT